VVSDFILRAMPRQLTVCGRNKFSLAQVGLSMISVDWLAG